MREKSIEYTMQSTTEKSKGKHFKRNGWVDDFFFKSSARYVVINWCVNEYAPILWHSMRLLKTALIFMPSFLATPSIYDGLLSIGAFISLPTMSVIYIEWRRLTICRIIHFNVEYFESERMYACDWLDCLWVVVLFCVVLCCAVNNLNPHKS